MSQIIVPVPTEDAPRHVQQQPATAPLKPARSPKRFLAISMIVLLVIGTAGFYGFRAYRRFSGPAANSVPTAKVQRGDLTLTINARGDLKGQNPEILTAPLTGGRELHLTSLPKPGTLVQSGDVVAQFDTTEQEYKLREAESDLAEAAQKILQAKAQQQAQEEEDRYALHKAATDVKVAELDVRKNPMLATIVARENELALSSARDHLAQLKKNLANRHATDIAAGEIQEAGRIKAEAQAATARQNIAAMSLKAHRSGYISIDRNSNVNMYYSGMTLPLFQVGDVVRPGMAVAEIPDLKNWEVDANIGELDRGHLAIGDAVEVSIIAVPGRSFGGHVKDIGGTTGPPWDRRFSCKLALDTTASEMRPGMSARVTITTDRMRQVLWLPAQALFESDGRTFVYAQSGTTFTPKTVKLVRRNETRVVVSGLAEGSVVALANPLEMTKKKTSSGGALQSVRK